MRWTIYPAKARKVCLADHAMWARHTNSMRVIGQSYTQIRYRLYLPCGSRNIRLAAARR